MAGDVMRDGDSALGGSASPATKSRQGSYLDGFDTLWHAQIGVPTVADSILDRLVHAAHKLELQGESMRKKRSRGNKDGE